MSEQDKRVYSAIDTEKQASSLNNRSNNKANKEVILDYSISKNLEEFGPNPFDKAQRISEFDSNNIESMKQSKGNADGRFPSIEKSPNNKYEISQKTQNPYKTEKLQISLKKKDLLYGNEKLEKDNENWKSPVKSATSNKKITDSDQNDNSSQENYNLTPGNNKKIEQHRKVISQTYFTFEQEEIAVN